MGLFMLACDSMRFPMHLKEDNGLRTLLEDCLSGNSRFPPLPELHTLDISKWRTWRVYARWSIFVEAFILSPVVVPACFSLLFNRRRNCGSNLFCLICSIWNITRRTYIWASGILLYSRQIICKLHVCSNRLIATLVLHTSLRGWLKTNRR
jgi:hypothetical protein